MLLNFVEDKLLRKLVKTLIKRQVKRAGVNPAWLKEYQDFKSGPKGSRVVVEGVLNNLDVDGIEADMGLVFVKTSGAVSAPPSGPPAG